MTPPPPIVYIVDDDASVRKSLTRLVTAAGYRIHAFASAREYLAREPATGPSCLVLDVRMPGLTGLDLQKALAGEQHRPAIVFITGHGDIAMSVTAMKAGAVDFLTKPFAGKDLLDAIQRGLARDTRDLSTEARVAEIRERMTLLTPRETEVFALVVTGMLNKQIASELGIGEKTVKVHRARVMEKMRAGSVAELVRLADGVGVIVPRT
ncbi:MAG TPA: response regulator transcription factor [Methylomirabilota bacterium]|jgi:FixJ family two-component response regulator|nr:response regulator transcription factor [Methylomirabilota bacterium]